VTDAKTRTAESITKARIELDRALAELDALRTFDPALLGVVAHAMSNYITVTTATVEMLQISLRDYPDADVPIWLEGIAHAANLMQHSIGRLVAVGAPRDFPLKLDFVNLPLLIQRACDYHRRRAEPRGVRIVVDVDGAIPLIWADRVALAVVADNLLTNAVQVSPIATTVDVRIDHEPGHIVCRIHDHGAGLTREEQARLFGQPLPAQPVPRGISGSGSTPGSGFGVAIAREFIHRLGGELWCDSEKGLGATFAFRLAANDD
jgi:signal transduction histidine kinase